MILIDGKKEAAELRETLKHEVSELKEKSIIKCFKPGLERMTSQFSTSI